MAENSALILVALAAFLGGVASAVLGFLGSHEPFDERKFMRSMLAALLSGMGIALAYRFADGVGVRDLFMDFLSGSGVDVLSNRALGTARRGPPRPPTP